MLQESATQTSSPYLSWHLLSLLNLYAVVALECFRRDIIEIFRQRTRLNLIFIGLHVVEMSPSRHFLPQVVASPILTPLKEEDELEDIDVSSGEFRFHCA